MDEDGFTILSHCVKLSLERRVRFHFLQYRAKPLHVVTAAAPEFSLAEHRVELVIDIIVIHTGKKKNEKAAAEKVSHGLLRLNDTVTCNCEGNE
jgi:hypothetical protein